MEGNIEGLEGNIGDLEEEIKRLTLTGHLPLTRETGRGFPLSNEAYMDPGFIEYISGHPQEPEPQPEPQLEPQPEPQLEPDLRSAWIPEPIPSQDVVDKFLEEAKKPFDISKVKFESNTPAHEKFKEELKRYNKKRAKIEKIKKIKKRSSTPKLTSMGLDQSLEQLMNENQGLGIARKITAIEYLLNLREMSSRKK